METETQSDNHGRPREKAIIAYVVAALVAGVAAVLLFFVFYGIPRDFEAYAHRNDERWQERNNPTTTTTVFVAAPLDDAFARDFQAKLDEAVRLLRVWDGKEGVKWESFSPYMQATYNPSIVDSWEGWIPVVVKRIERFAELSQLWENIYQGDRVDFYDCTACEAESGWDRSSFYWDNVSTDAHELLETMRQELWLLERGLLWTTICQGYSMTEADRAFISSWKNVVEDIEWSLRDAESALDRAYSKWYLAKDKAERPERYRGSD